MSQGLDTSAAFLQKFAERKPPSPPPGWYTNWLGIVTDASLFPNGKDVKDTIRSAIPVGNTGDGVYGGAAEYAAVLTSLDTRVDRNVAVAVELGCGWAPWLSAFGVAGRRMGFRDIRLVGVEAEPARCEAARRHLQANGLAGEIIEGAAWSHDRELAFTTTDPLKDHGGAAADTWSETDYRGFSSDYTTVRGLSLRTICRGLTTIDLMHLDIQGAEAKVLEAAIELVTRQVRFLFIGTHSVLIEGQLLDLFFKAGWDLLWRDPVPFKYDRNAASLEAMSLRDGELVWRNPSL